MSLRKKGSMPSKSFLAAVAVCVIGASAAAWVSLDQAFSPQTQPQSYQGASSSSRSAASSSSRSQGFSRLEDAATPQSEIAKSSSSSAASSQPEASSSTPPAPSAASQPSSALAALEKFSYQLPVDGAVCGEFSNGELVKNETLGEWRTHDGLDLAAGEGTNVLAAAPGKVTRAYADPLWGTVVEITHPDNTVTIYCGLAANTPVKAGAEVKAGSVIGMIGQIPAESAMEPHLHFAAKQNGKYIDPQSLLA